MSTMSTVTLAASHATSQAGMRRPPSRRASSGGPAPCGELRLTGRGRVVITLLFLALVLAVLTLLSGYSAAIGSAGDPAPTRTVVVEEGDTLWGIAAGVADGRDLREVIHEIERLNALSGPGLVEGQELAVPVP